MPTEMLSSRQVPCLPPLWTSPVHNNMPITIFTVPMEKKKKVIMLAPDIRV